MCNAETLPLLHLYTEGKSIQVAINSLDHVRPESQSRKLAEWGQVEKRLVCSEEGAGFLPLFSSTEGVRFLREGERERNDQALPFCV